MVGIVSISNKMNRLRYSTIQTIFKKVTHVIFDLDGLLIDSERVYKRVVAEIAREHGRKYTPEIRLKVLGRPDVIGSQIAVKEMNLPMTPQQFLKEYKGRCYEQLTNVPLLPGASQIIRHLHKHSVPIAVATSSSEDSVNIKLAKHKELFSLFNHIVTGGSDPEVKKGKPNPDIFLICASRFSSKPNALQCLAFEDSPNGVTAAITAGMQCIMIPEEDLLPEHTKHATQVLKSLEDIKLEQYGLPSLNNSDLAYNSNRG